LKSDRRDFEKILLRFTGIYFWTLSIVIVFFSKPLRFEGWFFRRPQVKPALLDPFDRAGLYLWAFKDELLRIL
jgi:hypothetical protein